MALQAIPGGVWLPIPWYVAVGTPAIFELFLNASGDKFGFIVPVPKSGTLDRFECLLTIYNNPDNGLRFSFQTVDTTTGLPDGVVDQFRDLTGALTSGWQTPAALTSDGTGSGSKRTVTAGEMLACVVEFISFVALDEVSVWSYSADVQQQRCYEADGTTGTYTKRGDLPVLALQYSDGTYATFSEPVWPMQAITAHTFQSASSPDERGLRFTLPITAACGGAWVRIDLDAAATITLYDVADVVLATASVVPGIRSTIEGTTACVYWDPVTLTAGAVYRLTVTPTTGSTVSIYDMTLASTALQACIPGGTSWYGTTRTDAGAWTDTTTIRPFMGVQLTSIETEGGGGGGLSWAPLSVVAAGGLSLLRSIASGATSGRG